MGLVPIVREAAESVVWVTLDDIDFAQASGFETITIYYDTTIGGSFADTLSSTIALESNTSEYRIYDSGAVTGRYYKAALTGGTKSAARLYGSSCAYVGSHDVRRELSSSTGKAALSSRHGHTLWNMAEDVSRLIDRMERLQDGAYTAATSEIKYFDGSGVAALWLTEPVLTITKVEVEETDGTWSTWTEDTDFFAWPYNKDYARRFDVSHRSGSTKSVWTYGRRRVRITGVFGVSSTVPDTIRRACLIQVARWYKRATQGYSDVGGMSDAGMLQYVRKLDPDVQLLVQNAEPIEVRI